MAGRRVAGEAGYWAFSSEQQVASGRNDQGHQALLHHTCRLPSSHGCRKKQAKLSPLGSCEEEFQRLSRAPGSPPPFPTGKVTHVSAPPPRVLVSEEGRPGAKLYSAGWSAGENGPEKRNHLMGRGGARSPPGREFLSEEGEGQSGHEHERVRSELKRLR